jgi:hypothetical protein
MKAAARRVGIALAGAVPLAAFTRLGVLAMGELCVIAFARRTRRSGELKLALTRKQAARARGVGCHAEKGAAADA